MQASLHVQLISLGQSPSIDSFGLPDQLLQRLPYGGPVQLHVRQRAGHRQHYSCAWGQVQVPVSKLQLQVIAMNHSVFWFIASESYPS